MLSLFSQQEEQIVDCNSGASSLSLTQLFDPGTSGRDENKAGGARLEHWSRIIAWIVACWCLNWLTTTVILDSGRSNSASFHKAVHFPVRILISRAAYFHTHTGVKSRFERRCINCKDVEAEKQRVKTGDWFH
jgi:hypothetical protein